MPTNRDHLQWTEKLFRDVIEHLQERIRGLESKSAGDCYNDEEIDFVGDERTLEEQSTITALRLEICLYRLCVDWVRQQREILEGISDGERRRNRENFSRLRASMAPSERTRDAHGRSFGFTSEMLHQSPVPNAVMFTALEGSAERPWATLMRM